MKWLFLILFILPCVYAQLEITEIMYNPEGSDNNKEYVEVFTDGMNISNITLEDLASIDTLELLKQTNSSYALIVEADFNHTNLNVTIYTTGATIGNNLNNDHDLVLLREATDIVDAITYASNIGADGNGKALCRTSQTKFQECNPSPGKENNLTIIENITVKINEFLPNPKGHDNAAMPDGEWIELYNYGDQELNLEGLELKDESNKKIIISNVTTLDGTSIQGKGFLTVYTNGLSGFLNNEGFEKITFGRDEISYSFSKESMSWSASEEGLQLTIPTPGTENKFGDEKAKPTLQIQEVYLGADEKATFGDTIQVKVGVNKGSSTKNVAYLYVPKLSKQTKIAAYDTFETYNLTVPVQLNANCKKKFRDGSYKLILEGFDMKTEQEIRVEGNSSLCQTITKKVEVKAAKQKATTKKVLASAPDTHDFESLIKQDGQVVYQDAEVKARRAALYFFCLALILVVISFIVVRE